MPKPEDLKFCVSCHCVVKDYYNYCPRCGAPVKKEVEGEPLKI